MTSEPATPLLSAPSPASSTRSPALSPLAAIDSLLNSLTMYRLLVYGLAALLLLAVGFSLAGSLRLSVGGLLATAGLTVGVCLGSDWALRRSFGVAANYESALITGLILACILPQATSLHRALGVCVAALLAIASKYLLVWQGKHVFNPAAFGAAAAGWLGVSFTGWWIGTPVMFGFTLLFGWLILRKLHRFALVGWFLLAVAAVSLLVAMVQGANIGSFFHNLVFSGPALFLAGVMLTEPATMPTRRYYQMLFALLVGSLFASQLHIFGQLISPQAALLVGNIFAFAVCFRRTAVLKLIGQTQLSPNLYEFAFQPDHPIKYQAGQYMAWTLPHRRPDRRGNRRTFTLASSPTEDRVRVAVRLEQKGSSYKHRLAELPAGSTLAGSQLAGDFVLPANPERRLVWIAGGIGITPFRSMAKYLTDQSQQRQIELFYLARQPEDFVYRDVFQAAQSIGLNSHYLASSGLTFETLRQAAGKLDDVLFYVAGPNAMVQHYRRMLRRGGVPGRHIITDYFSGY